MEVWETICPKLKWLFLALLPERALLPESTKKPRAEAPFAEARNSLLQKPVIAKSSSVFAEILIEN